MANNSNTSYIKRNPIELLPGYFQTDSLKKVFNATVNHLFQPESVEFLNGYIGHIPPWYNSTTDFYIPEPNTNRANYQLDPTIVSASYQNPELSNAMFYEDLIGQLNFQGGITNNHNRLFSQEYYSWSPPINLDMFVNYTNYYWLPNGPNGILLYGTTDLENTAVGQLSYSYVGTALYTATNTTVVFTADAPLVFSSGLKIIPTNDLTIAINGQELILDGVGRAIVLINFTDNSTRSWSLGGWSLLGYDGAEPAQPSYITIERNSQDGNQWSTTNRWFHIQVIEQSFSSVNDLYEYQAARPIIQFDGNMQLWNYGIINRGVITVVDVTNADLLGTIVGQPSWVINSVSLQDGMRILGLADTTMDAAGKIFIVSGQSSGAIQLTVDLYNSAALNGSPTQGDRAIVQYGVFQGQNILYNNNQWSNNCQQQLGVAPPLFQLYDTNGNSVSDPSVYPNSNFTGSQIFSYAVDPTQPVDKYIGQSLELDQFGEWVFDNNLSTDIVSYVLNGASVNYTGQLFAQIGAGGVDTYVNSWYTAPQLSRQYIINEFVITTPISIFVIDQTPAQHSLNTLPTIFVTYNVNQVETLLVNGVDYTVANNIVTLTTAAITGSIIEIASWNPVAPAMITGYYQIPLNLSANPNNLPITTISRSQFMQQFTEIIQNQTGIVGLALGVNNYRDTAQQRGLGLSILQHRAPMLKLGLLNSVSLSSIGLTTAPTDPVQSMQYAENSYTRFYNRFLRALFGISSQQGFSASSNASACDPYNTALWVSTALTQINVGKTRGSPWANTGYGGAPGSYGIVPATTPLYIPATATRLGIASAYQPVVYYDTSFSTPQLTIQTHDGARIIMTDAQGLPLGTILYNQSTTTNPEQLTNPIAAAWLQFELNMFNNLPASYADPQANLVFDITTYSPGKWRTSDYTAAEYLQLQSGAFDKWCIFNQVEYNVNSTYNAADPFSFNYRSVRDHQGNSIPGYWQGIYRWFYDTDRPHVCPWEMLGFSQMPPWWTTQYGPAPFTSGNIAMWQDLSNGVIRQGPRAGTYTNWARPDLLSCIPVDQQGNLLPPVQAGCAASIPTVAAAQSPWIFGDGSPIESVWIHSQYYPFVEAVTGYLMKPAAFIEYTWDSLRTEEIYSGTDENQWIYLDTNARRSSNQFYINRETPTTLITGTTVPNESDLSYFASAGFQVWITEYVVSQGLSVTNYIGNVLRGGDVQLAHRMAGYVNSTNFRGIVDSFGQLGYNSQIIPPENINTYLYRSTSNGTFVYSGVIVEQVTNGWMIYGYDPVTPIFNIIPSNTAGQRNSVVVGNQKIVEYQTGLSNIVTPIPYNTVLTTYQQVYDFIVSYGRWLTSQGWVFNQFNTTLSIVLDWSQSAKEFLLWAQGSWNNGTIIALSPSATSITLFQPTGMIQYVNGIISGTYPVVDRSGNPIQSQNVNVLRENNSITIRPTNEQGVYGLRLFTTTIEHAVFFNNFTSFGDVIYQPLYNLQQERIKIYTYRANGWDGTIDAPGYIVIQGNTTVNGQTVTSNTWTMTNNFEKTASDFTRYFNIDEPSNYEKLQYGGERTVTSSSTLGSIDNPSIANLARHSIAYQPRDYLQNLLLDDSVEFQFYQGFIKQKGTLASINALLRSSTVIPTGSTFNYYDEWMIRVGAYGATALNVEIEYILPQSGITYDPQWIRFFSATSNNPNSNVFDIVPNDPLLVTPPATYSTDIFGLRHSYAPNIDTDVPTAGYPQLGETTQYVVNTNELLGLYRKQSITASPLNAQDTVWQFITDNGSWMVWILAIAASQISYTITSASFGGETTIVTTDAHGLLNGDICVINGVTGASEINNTYIINSVTSTTFNIPLSTFQTGSGGNIWVYRPMRFATLFARDSSPPPGGYQSGNLVYVDHGGIDANAWTVYRYVNSHFVAYRQQALQVNPTLLQSSQLYNVDTGINVANVEYWDPVKGIIPGQAQQEINYTTDVDPAIYNSGDTSSYLVNPSLAWSSAQVGKVWWDLSQVRYIDYEQGDESYRLRSWGKIAPGTTVVVYEWVKSSIPPTSWANAVAAGTVITVGDNQIVPSGVVKQPYNWCQITQYDMQNTATTYYYFWVGNSSMPAAAAWRNMPTLAIANIIQNPSLIGLPWYAAISSNSIVLGNATALLNGIKVAQLINYTSKVNNENIYSQWELIREGDATSPINTTVWSRLKASLIAYDGLGNDVPDYRLNAYNKYGTLIRPRQTWFANREAASALFVSTFNALIAASTTPIVYNTSKTGWLNFFNAAEPIPTQYTKIYRNIVETVEGVGSIPPYVVVTNTVDIVAGQTIVLSNYAGGLLGGVTYYILSVLSQTTFTVSSTPNGLPFVLGNSTISTIATIYNVNWDYQVADINQRDGLVGAILPGQLILIDATTVTQNLWTIWEYTPGNSQSWQLVKIQAYNTANFWTYINWYAAGYSSSNPPTQTVATIGDLDALSNVSAGQLVAVDNGGDGNYQWWAYLGGIWTVVAQQNGSIQILPSIYQWANDFGGFDGAPFDGAGTSLVFNPNPSFDQTAAIDFANIIDGIYYEIYPGPNSIELNTLFFSMTNYVVAEQLQVDWIFKTSNMVFTGFNQNLAATPILAVDNTQSILEFINEAKPYHAQIQDYISGYAALDNARMSVVDFDVPYASLTQYTPTYAAPPSNIIVSSSNLESVEYASTYTAWYTNYQPATNINEQSYIDPSLIRQLSTTIVFDRISTPSITDGWGSTWSIFGWAAESASQNLGAQLRIQEYYEPTAGMIPNILSDLMQGVVYKGQTIGNLGFKADPGWDGGPWGGLLGWDATSAVVNAYLDQIIQGGPVPNYDVAIGNGSTVAFPLVKGSQNPNNLVVWADGDIKLYGVDWIIPTFAINVYIIDGGTGYAVGDQLIVNAGTGIVPVRLIVNAVNHGSLTSVTIVGKGLYSTVTPSAYTLSYPTAYPGIGVSATVGIDWDCSNIQFTAPPASSAVPNIFILYVGTTFESASVNPSDTIYDGYKFVQPYVDDNHPEELFPMLPRDCLMMDTYLEKISGRPIVSSRVYITDGVSDQYDLIIMPQNDNAVMAYLADMPLVIGISGDAVINYNTKRLVFINTPAAGQLLYIVSIGFGGAGSSVASAYVVSGGTGYEIGDTVTIAAGMSFNPPILSVASIGANNRITKVDVINAGLYPRLPDQPVVQSATNGTGIGATFNLAFTDKFAMYSFTGDDVTTDYVLPNITPYVSGVMVTVDGVIQPYSWLSYGIRLASAPSYGAVILVATFATSNFSIVNDTMINIINPAQHTYNITTPYSTLPVYVTTTVRKNGNLMLPPNMQTYRSNGYQTDFFIAEDISDSTGIQVYVDSVLSLNYTIAGQILHFTTPPVNNADIVLICHQAINSYTINGNTITFAAWAIALNDEIIVTTYSQDIDYEWRVDEFPVNSSNLYPLSNPLTDKNTVEVWYNTVLQLPQVNYIFTTIPAETGWTAGGWDTVAWNIDQPETTGILVNNPNITGAQGWATVGWEQIPWAILPAEVVISYMIGRPNAPAIAWRTTTGWDAVLSTALDPNATTVILSNVYTYSTSIEVADFTKLSIPQPINPGLIYINNELISFTEIQIAPTVAYPNRAFLAGIARDRLGTSGSPLTLYNTQWYNGDGATQYFATESATQAISTTVFVNEHIQVENVDYTIVINPPAEPYGAYVMFVMPPAIGIKNIQITSLNQIGYNTQVSHQIPATVTDAGTNVQIPGGYDWISTPNGLQYSDSSLAVFLLEHSVGG